MTCQKIHRGLLVFFVAFSIGIWLVPKILQSDVVNEENNVKIEKSNTVNLPKVNALIKTAPTPKHTGEPVSGGIINGKALELPKPEYPIAARKVKAKGKVHVQVLVNKEGNVVSASAVAGNKLFYKSAEDAARKAKFAPLKLYETTLVTFSGIIVYDFHPNE